MRRVATLHGIGSFFFNTAILALTVGVAAKAAAESQKFAGNPSLRRAMMFFWISEVPPPIVSTTV